MKSNLFARTLRKQQTEAEKRLWWFLRNRQISNCKFRRQQAVGPFIVDFLCLEKRLIVELDGGQHAERKEYHEKRSKYLEQYGFNVLRFWDNEVWANMGSVAELRESLRRLLLRWFPGFRPRGEESRVTLG